MKKKIAVVLVNRANYARMKPVMKALQTEPDVSMQTLCAGSMLLDRYGCAKNVVEADGLRQRDLDPGDQVGENGSRSEAEH